MIVGVYAVVVILFGGGLFTFDGIRDMADEIIKDKDRAKQVMAITKQADKGYEEFAEELDKLSKQFVTINKKYNTTREEIDSFSSQAKYNRVAFFNKYVELRFQMKNLITAEEWQAMHP
jgi:uncharacterized phage infection (PIP) family protein YhgE